MYFVFEKACVSSILKKIGEINDVRGLRLEKKQNLKQYIYIRVLKSLLAVKRDECGVTEVFPNKLIYKGFYS